MRPTRSNAPDYLATQRVRIALQGHAPIAAATQAVYETLKSLSRRQRRAEGSDGACFACRSLARVMREAETKARSADVPRIEEVSRAILQVVIRGGVQGVGYRAWVEYQASAIGLEGWVRNRR